MWIYVDTVTRNTPIAHSHILKVTFYTDRLLTYRIANPAKIDKPPHRTVVSIASLVC